MIPTIRILIAAALMFLSSVALPAYTNPAFEVATIKPSDPEKPQNALFLADGRFIAHGQTLMTLIKYAYGLNTGSDQQVSGGPKWLTSDKFDVDAKEDEQTAAALKQMSRLQTTQQVRLMLQSLLAERFGVKVHHEPKLLPVLALVVAKGGARMTLVAEPSATWSGMRQAGRGELEGHNVTMDIFSEVIAHEPEVSGRMVVDQTSLTGNYNFTLKWTPESASSAAGPDSTAPPLLTALQEQLGLKLDSTHASVDTIIVEAATQPTSN